MRIALSLALVASIASLVGCAQSVVDEDAASSESQMSREGTQVLGRKLAAFGGRWLTSERRSDEVDVVVKLFDDERGGYNTDVRFQTTNLVLRYMIFGKIDGGEVCSRTLHPTTSVESCADSKLSADGRTLRNTETDRATDKETKAVTESVRVQTLALEGDRLHYVDVAADGTKTVDLFLDWDDKQPPRAR